MPRFLSRGGLFRPLALALLMFLAAAPTASAAFMTINFDTVPVLPLAPNTFTTAQQNINVAGLATVTGGTLVSTPTFLASFGPGGGASTPRSPGSYAEATRRAPRRQVASTRRAPHRT